LKRVISRVHAAAIDRAALLIAGPADNTEMTAACTNRAPPEYAGTKVPEVTLVFWIIKIAATP
jgi:hypothetical protein